MIPSLLPDPRAFGSLVRNLAEGLAFSDEGDGSLETTG